MVKATKRFLFVMTFAALALALVAVGISVARWEHHEIRNNVARDLEHVADLKVQQIATWRAERLADIQVQSHSPLLLDHNFGLASGSPAARTKLQDWLRTRCRYYGYHDVLLVDAQGRVLLSANDESVGTSLPLECRQVMGAALSSGRPIWHDVHYSADAAHNLLELAAPLVVTGHTTAVALVYRMEPRDSLFPIIQRWPSRSISGETLLVRRDGDDVLFLNDLRHQSNTAMRLRVSLAQADLPAVRAVRGETGLLEGADYRGVPTLAVARAVPGSAWYVVAKEDLSEIYAPLVRMNWLVAGVVLALVLGCGALMFGLWTRREQELYRAQWQADQHLAITLNSIGDAVVATDAGGCITRMNPVAEKLTGWPLAEARGRPLDEVLRLIHAVTRQPAPAPVQRVLAEGVVVGLANHTLLVARDGREIAIADSAAPIRDEAGRIHGVIMVFRDVSAEYALDRELQESEAKYRQLFQNMSEAFALHEMIWDDQGRPRDYRFLDVNAAFEHQTGLDRAQVIGRTVLEILPHTEPAWIAQYGEVARSGATLSFEQYSGELKKYFHVRAFQPSPGRFAVVFADITDRKQAEEEMRVARDQAEAANHAKSMFLANMSHELRTPLNPVIGFADMLADAPNLTDEQREFARLIKARGADLLGLINDLLDLSRIEAGHLELALERLSLRQLVLDVARAAKLAADARKLQLTWAVAAEVPDEVAADALRLKQIIANLLNNAIKFTEQGGIDLRVVCDPQAPATRPAQPDEVLLHISVRDSGIGIDPEQAARIFDPFSQVDASYSRRRGGAGLGLAIARQLVQAMGGTLWVDSTLGQGSVFHFTVLLPTRSPALPAGTLAVAAPRPGPGAPGVLRVLVVEDDSASSLLIARMLTRAGHVVCTAGNGLEALRIYEEQALDLILMDVQMPDMDGVAATRAIQARAPRGPRRPPIIALTAYAMKGDRDRFLAEGMDGYLAKPITAESLSAAMVEVMGRVPGDAG